jgi:hypothetical protein
MRTLWTRTEMTDPELFRTCEWDAKIICEHVIPAAGVPVEPLARAMAKAYRDGNYNILNRFVWGEVTRKALAEFFPDGKLPAPYDRPTV